MFEEKKNILKSFLLYSFSLFEGLFHNFRIVLKFLSAFYFSLAIL